MHTSFRSPVFFPGRLATVNRLGALEGDGGTRLLVTPAQHRSEAGPTSTLRRYDALDLRLLYSSWTAEGTDTRPALAAPPALSEVASTVTGSTVDLQVRAYGDPAAGIQQVWVTRTAEQGPWHGSWASVDLVQDPSDSTLWTGSTTLPAGQAAPDVRFVVQAANGVGLVTMDDNQGAYYVPGTSPGLDPLPTGRAASTLDLTAPGTGALTSLLPVQATLADAQGPLAGRSVAFSLGGASTTAVTDAQGVAAAQLRLVADVGPQSLTATFGGDAGHAPAVVTAPVTVTLRPTGLTLGPDPAQAQQGADSGLVADLTALGSPLAQHTVYAVVRDPGGAVVAARTVTTDQAGRARLGVLPVGVGTWTVRTYVSPTALDVGSGATVTDVDPENAPAISAPVTLTVTAADPATVTVVSGSGQATVLGTAYPAPLVARVTDRFGNPVGGVVVTFAAPGSGPRTVPTSTTATTGADGLATVAVTAGSDPGGYDVTASAGAATAAVFRLVTQYRTGPFQPPLRDGAVNGVKAASTVPVKIALSGANGPLGRSAGTALAAGCGVRVTSTVQGSSTPTGPAVCLSWTGNQFQGNASGKDLGWVAGTTYTLTLSVPGSRPGEVLATRQVSVLAR